MELRPSRDASRAGTLRDRVPTLAALTRAGLFYVPPYDRPVEDECVWHLIKYLHPETKLLSQQRVEDWATGLVTYIDVLVILPWGPRIAFEITGNPEDPDESERRDGLVLDTGVVDVLYRVSEAAMLHNLHDVLYLLSRYEPEAFTDRAHVVLDRLAKKDAKAVAAGDLSDSGAEVRYAHSDDEDDVFASDCPVNFTLRRLPSPDRVSGGAAVAA